MDWFFQRPKCLSPLWDQPGGWWEKRNQKLFFWNRGLLSWVHHEICGTLHIEIAGSGTYHMFEIKQKLSHVRNKAKTRNEVPLKSNQQKMTKKEGHIYIREDGEKKEMKKSPWKAINRKCQNRGSYIHMFSLIDVCYLFPDRCTRRCTAQGAQGTG